MKQYQITEIHTASSGNNIFPYNYPYSNNDRIQVSINNNSVESSITEDEEGTINIELDDGTLIEDGDQVNILITKESNVLNILTNANINRPNTLFNKYQPADAVGKLMPNNKYIMHVNIDGEIFEDTFRSRLTPMFCTVKQIREDIGEFIPDYTDEYIESIIYQKSVEVIDLIDELANKDDPITNVTYELGQDGFYSTKYKPVKNWVRYATDIQLIYAKYFGISYNYGSIKKEIGDIKIERNTKLPYIDNLLDWLKKAFDEADAYIRGNNIAMAATRGKDQYSYEDWERTTNF